MIYVLLGIVILVVSFVIALFSLIRESKNENGNHEIVTEKTGGESNTKLEQTGHVSQVNVPKSVVSEEGFAKEVEKFPWEEILEEESGVESVKESSGVGIKVEEELEEKTVDDNRAGVISVQDMARKQNS